MNSSGVDYLYDGDYAVFVINYKLEETYFEFEVGEVVSWECDGDNTISETEKYLNGTIKWDGCSHVWFGDEAGYIHLCGGRLWKNHIRLMSWLWEKASSSISRWDNDCAEGDSMK